MGEESILLSRRLLAEALGTAILVATVIGSGIMASASPEVIKPSGCSATPSRQVRSSS